MQDDCAPLRGFPRPILDTFLLRFRIVVIVRIGERLWIRTEDMLNKCSRCNALRTVHISLLSPLVKPEAPERANVRASETSVTNSTMDSR